MLLSVCAASISRIKGSRGKPEAAPPYPKALSTYNTKSTNYMYLLDLLNNITRTLTSSKPCMSLKMILVNTSILDAIIFFLNISIDNSKTKVISFNQYKLADCLGRLVINQRRNEVVCKPNQTKIKHTDIDTRQTLLARSNVSKFIDSLHMRYQHNIK